MFRRQVLASLFAILWVFPGFGAVRGEDDARIEPVGGIRWNDRVGDVQRKLAASGEMSRIGVSVLFNDAVTTNAFGPRSIAPGSEEELLEAVSSLAREYLAGVADDRSKGTGILAKAFDLNCAAILADKAGARKDYLDVILRLSAKPFLYQGLPFELTAEFRAHPGAGLTARYTLPVRGTKYVLPVVLTMVTLVPSTPFAARKFPEVAEALGKSYETLRRCTAGASEGWCDSRAVSVSFVRDAGGPAALRFDAGTFWVRGLDVMYKDHLRTLNGGKSCRCHAMPARRPVF